MDDKLILLGKRIASLRVKKGFTQEKLAEAVNYSTNHISKLELARTNPSFDLLVNIADAFNIEMKELFNFDDFENINKVREEFKLLSKLKDEKYLKMLYKIHQSLNS